MPRIFWRSIVIISYAAAVACSIAAAFLVDSSAAAAWFWDAAMCAGLVGSITAERRSCLRFIRTWHPSLRDTTLIIALLCAALFVRTVRLSTYPIYLHNDEASCGMFGRMFNSGEAPILSMGWIGLPMFAYSFVGLGLRFFGDTVNGMRTAHAMLGTVGVLFIYLLGKELWNKRTGFFAAFPAFVHICPYSLQQ